VGQAVMPLLFLNSTHNSLVEWREIKIPFHVGKNIRTEPQSQVQWILIQYYLLSTSIF